MQKKKIIIIMILKVYMSGGDLENLVKLTET